MADEEFFQRFKWDIFGDAVFEDLQGLWEPLWLLRGYLNQPGMSDTERQDLTVRALRELHREGLIYFFRVPPPGDPAEAADDPSLRLTAEEVEAELSGTWWRGRERLPADHPNVWWWATEKGQGFGKRPPPEINAYWRIDTSHMD